MSPMAHLLVVGDGKPHSTPECGLTGHLSLLEERERVCVYVYYAVCMCCVYILYARAPADYEKTHRND
jgi:hypothetical protein